MKKLVQEFKTFIMRGNVLDMAIGVIMATAFGKITTSLVNDVFMPFLGWICGARDMSVLNLTIRPAVLDETGAVVQEAITLGFGTFIGTVIDFIIIAFIVFIIVRTMNRVQSLMSKKEEEAPAAPPEPTKEEKLLTEIRDLLKK